ncbi:MAG TPA: M20/M25/M40 family metallo-hydrolase [Solirubrobacterales bacterium]|nr:M20/M25/M40 family metallo-hydrolase [Solirubrobacterales bacterium]
MGNERLYDTFARLCEIRSPTGEEREVADTLAAELRALGLEVEEDDAARPAEAGAGNLLARVPGERDDFVMFCAHVDTVPHEGRVEVVDDEGVFRSAGNTILGADNKAAVAVFMELARRAVENRPPVGVELLFTVAEEQGLRGAKAFDIGKLKASIGFVLDHAGPVGGVVMETPSQHKIFADFIGVEAHAGVRPEDGASAIEAAAAAIGRMTLGRLDECTTANVGIIRGGTSGNVVPGHCGIHAEARSLDAKRAAEVAGQIVDACTWGASEFGCDVDVRMSELFRGYKVPSSSVALGFAEESLRAAGLDPRRESIGGGSDANVFRLAGFDSLLLANGPDGVHTSGEHVAAADLDKMLEVCEGILARA